MKHRLAKYLVVLTLGLAGAFLVPANGQADYYPWGGWSWGGPTYSAGYYPGYPDYFANSNYWGGYYGGPYLDGYYTGYFPSYGAGYYGSGCCGSCGTSCCSSGCSSCSGGCGSCGTGCGTCSAGLACADGCGCGAPSCGCGVGCASGCGTGIASGPGCSGSNPPGHPPKKPAVNSDDNFVPRPSPRYDDEPPATRRPKAPRTPPAEPGATGGPAAGNDVAPPSEPPAVGFKRGQGNEQGSASATKGPAGESPDFKSPTSPKGQSTSPAGEGQFNANKPVSPAPKQPAKKKAPVKNPDAALNENGSYRLTSSGGSDETDLASNPALGLQERLTWSYATPHHFAAGRLARLTIPATPTRLKSESIERAADPVETRLARN
ncbi:MAG TPA: hypothetical protein VHX68_06240 [Planctomycetaceae bacterium]|nr:hypothetical protein [Planctomycetaceae bacterium]